ncbi:hypothetical protein [Mycobacterium decipiens]|nr:hypothetical protein [Mycobacterium decipiens]
MTPDMLWSGRAAELAGLQVGDIDWPVNPNGQVYVRVRRTVMNSGDDALAGQASGYG